MQVRWTSFDFRSGRRGGEVLTSRLGQISRKVGEPTDLTLEVACWNAGTATEISGWNSATLPGATGLLAVDEDDEILWGGYVFRRRGSIAAAKIPVSVATIEHYLNRRYVSTHEWTGVDDSVIFAGLIADATVDGPPMIVDCPATGRSKDRYYYSDEDRRVLGALQELMDVEDGIEFTAIPEWTDETHTAVRFRIVGRPRLGTAAAPIPKVTFNYPGNLIGGDYVEDYSEEHGANDVMAASSGEGEGRPESEHHTAVLPTWAKFERRISTPVGDDETSLDAHAAAELAQTWDGLKELSLEARLDDSTHPKVWSLGDDIGVSITSPRFPERRASDMSIVDGYSATVRAVGWSIDLDAQTITPTLVERQEIP